MFGELLAMILQTKRQLWCSVGRLDFLIKVLILTLGFSLVRDQFILTISCAKVMKKASLIAREAKKLTIVTIPKTSASFAKVLPAALLINYLEHKTVDIAPRRSKGV